MLRRLSIQNIALIDRLVLELKEGLTVLTGETGAGKSILLDSLNLVLGSRMDSRLIRKNAPEAVVEAVFEVKGGHPAHRLLADSDYGGAAETIVLRRTMTEGASRASINDRPAPVGVLRQIGGLLVEIQGQFDAHGLADPAAHTSVLDSFCGCLPLARSVAEAKHLWEAQAAELRQTEDILRMVGNDQSYFRHVLEELEAADPQIGEEEALQTERRGLLREFKKQEILQQMQSLLRGEGGLGAAGGRFSRLADRLKAEGESKEPQDDEAEEERDESEDEEHRTLADGVAVLEETLRALERSTAALQSRYEDSAGRLADIDARLGALRDLARKHRCSVEELGARRVFFATRLSSLEDAHRNIESLQQALEEARAAFFEQAAELSEKRRAGARDLEEKIQNELTALHLPQARFFVHLKPHAQGGAQGLESVLFSAATNPGLDGGPLHKIASGGELSRFMLAIKFVLQRTAPAVSLIFDEADAGIGGATAYAVGDRLGLLGESAQVLSITHSPQVAARGTHHLKVRKETRGGETFCFIDELSGDRRLEEIARMLSGLNITPEALSAAEKLLEGKHLNPAAI